MRVYCTGCASPGFTVEVDGDVVTVSKYTGEYMITRREDTRGEILYVCVADEIFIGRSPWNKITEYGRYGIEYDGNSVLLRIREDYMYINHEIYTFHSKHRIVSFVSPIGPGRINYPYAHDAVGNTYLFTVQVILDASLLPTLRDKNPYDYYYDSRTLWCREFNVGFLNITTFYLNDEVENLTYGTAVEPEDKLQIRVYGRVVHISYDMYNRIMRLYGRIIGLSELEHRSEHYII